MSGIPTVICHGDCITVFAAGVPIPGNFAAPSHFLRFFIGLRDKPAAANICAGTAI
jgi:hypothetical protein